MTPVNQTPTTPDLFWLAIDYAIKGAGAILFIILTAGWRDYRKNIKMINELHIFCRDFNRRTKQIEELLREVAVLKKDVERLESHHD